MKRIISILLALSIVLPLFCTSAGAAETPDEALGEVGIFSGGFPMAYLAVNGKVQKQEYTYFLFPDSTSGEMKEIPAYCVNPSQHGVPQTVGKGESIEYLAEERASDPKVVGLVANMYPHRSLQELKLDNLYQAFYAGKIALWCYLIPEWDISKVTVAPGLSGIERERGERLLAAAVDIYNRGMAWGSVPEPRLTTTPDRETAYPVTIDGKAYKQQVFTVTSDTWVCDYAVHIKFQTPNDVPQGARITDMDNKDIDTLLVMPNGGSYNGKFKVLYPAESVQGENGSVQLALTAEVYKYAVFYALCQEKDKYGNLQSYLCDTDPQTTLLRTAISKFEDSSTPPPPDTPDTALKIVKLDEGTDRPLAGASFEVVGPSGDTIGIYTTGANGTITIPLTTVGNYTVYERVAPKGYLLSEEPAQNVTVTYGQTATAAFHNAPYGNLRIEKIDADTGDSLAGARVQIKHIESGATHTGITGTGGSYTFSGLKPGAYEILELSAPEGWQKDPQTYTATVVTGETVVFTLKNDALPGLRIVKYDRETHATMPGVSFRVYRDAELLGSYETDALGEIVLTDLRPGTYRVEEEDAGGSGHIKDPIPQEVGLRAGEGIKTLYFYNDRKPGIHLVKVDAADPSMVIPNAVFEIRSVDGSFGPREFTTDEHGEIDLAELDPGAYMVTEKSCAGYIIDEAQRIIQLRPNHDEQFVFTNAIRPSLRLIKLSADGSPLPGVTFRIAKIEDGSHYLDRTTNAQGEILIADLAPGVYSVKETATREDHLLDPVEHHVELFAGRTSTIVLNNDMRPSLTIHKSDADTGAPVAGAVFTVKAADGHTVNEVEAGPDGTATLENLLPIVYEVAEKSVPATYLLDAPSQLITLYPNRNSDIYFENHKKPSLVIEKLDSITGDPIQRAKFEIWYGSNDTTTGELNSLGTFFTDESGRIELTGLQDGWYKVTELEPAKGYAIKAPDTQECYIKGGEGKALTFQNVPLSALVVYKYDEKTGAALEGAVFEVRYLGGTSGTGGTVIGSYKTSANGSFVVTGLKAGAYVVEEVRSSPHYTIDSAPQTAYLSGEDQDVVKLYIGNQPHGAVLIKKLADGTGHTPLAGAVFMVTDDKGAVIGTGNGAFTTDKNGAILISDLTAGTTVIVKELRAPAGYALDGTPQTVRVEAGETHTLHFYNKPLCDLTILKRDSATKQPLAGAQFLVTDGASAPIGPNNGRYTSGDDGLVSITGLTPGQTIIVREEQAPVGYVRDWEPKSITVQSGMTNSLTFDNAPKGTLIIVKRDSKTKKPLAGATFKVTASNGELIPNAGGAVSSNGLYTTDANGQIVISGLEPGTLVVAEEQAPSGYMKDPTPQTVVINTNDTQTLTFENTPTSTLTIQKYVEGTTTPIRGVTFLVTDSSGAVVGPNNGEYTTDRNGCIVITGLTPGTTVTARETRTAGGFVLDGTPQSILIKEGEAQTLTFHNRREGGLELTKVDADNRSVRIPDVEFEIHRMNGGLVDTVITDRRGRVHVDLEAGDYYALEVSCPKEYKLDPTPHYFTVEDGAVTELIVKNTAFSGILIHKVDSVTGKGIPDVTFLLYDGQHNPVDQFTTDQRGYAYVDTLDFSGRVYLRELEAPGYVVDVRLKTVYVKPGETTEITWKNTPITGQIQIAKKSADDNPINGLPAGTGLEGARFEVYDKAGNVMDTIVSGSNGLAVSQPLPLDRYTIREVQAPAYYSLDGTPVTVYLDHSGQIVRLEMANKSVSTGVSIDKTGPREAMSGQPVRYVLRDIANTSTVPLSSFYWRDYLPSAVRLEQVVTGTYNKSLTYKIVYRVNGGDYRTLADSLSTTKNHTLDASPAALGLAVNEKVTELMCVFGQVPAGFAQVDIPYLYTTALPGLAPGSSFTNTAEAGGVFNGVWVQAVARWVTAVYGKPVPLPRTGY
ncbi:SpaA isopeptide-forming pilin-related protein [Intestinimonas butyriciproducens]|uniref:Carboxypeptidase family protein n=1 Tax=Intestinimonas butyriciproducens TaxID=1297617 RepID=A0A2U1CBY0_9FIRM|nr:SpaA isopeptide-forming pilin-related protein [Intestinimonas butyriciproducens]MCR1906264.1 SpaA isopeptide-forming pilin-related protein [Intestinimonas butyriciproducens]PVY58422.1 carboxypeptidase family protein [Intestinimonas butyriciproducens]QBB65439.1 cell surface protein precursor [Intestinimonas butyriciproducens]